jgi:hypothetical protein
MLFDDVPTDSAITPVDVDNVQSETAVTGQQMQGIQDQIQMDAGEQCLMQQESEDAQAETSQEADVARLPWAQSTGSAASSSDPD